MATDTERLVLQMSADIAGLQKAMTKAEAVSDKTADGIERRFDKMQGGLNRNFGKIGDTLRTAFAAIAVGAIVKDVTALADSYTSITNQLRSFKDVVGDTDEAQKRLVATATASNTNLEAAAAVLGAAARAARDLGESGENVFLFTEAVGKGASIANTGAAAVAGAITQLGQAVASPSVQLGEFNSIIEGTPRLAQAFADGIERAGGSVSKLRKLIGSGQVSGAQLFQGLLSQLPKLRAEFASADVTIAAAFTNLQTRITAYVGETNQATNATASLVPVINFLATNVEAFADTAVVALVALSGALVGLGSAALLGAIGRNAAAILATRAGMALVTAEATRLAIAEGTLTAANIGLYRSALQASTSINVLSVASKLGATAMGALRVALAAVGGPLGLIGAAVAILAFELSKVNIAQEIATKVARDYAPELERIEKATTALSTATGELAVQHEIEAKAALQAAIAKARLAKANIDAAESALKLREAELQGGSFSEQSQLDPETQAGIGAALAQQEGRIARQKAELAELGRQINKQIDDLAAAQGAVRSAAAPGKTDPVVTAGGGRLIGDVTDPGADKRASAAVRKRTEAAEALAQAKQLRQELKADAESFIDRIPTSSRAARVELQQLRALIDAGIFANLGEEQSAARAEVEVLKQIAYAAGDASEAIRELARVNNLTAEEAAAAARNIKEAARQGRAERDEELGRIIRVGEIRDDVKSALSQAFRSGDYGEAFREKIGDALDRAFDRSIDKATDALFDLILQATKLGGSDSGGGGKGGGIVSAIIKGIGALFGGKRATGGPVSAGRGYLVGEKGPEPFFPTQNGFVLPNNFMNAMNSQPRLTHITQTTNLKVAYSIDLTGANGDQQIRAIARQEAQRGAAEALRLADAQAPARQARLQKLGT